MPIAELGQFAKRRAGPLSPCYDGGRTAKIKVVVEITLAHLKPEPPDVKVTVEPETLSPEQLDDAARDTPLRSTQSGTGVDDKARQVGRMDVRQRMADQQTHKDFVDA